jgi:hypothetical protein
LFQGGKSRRRSTWTAGYLSSRVASRRAEQVDKVLLKGVGAVLLVVAAILFFAEVGSGSVSFGLAALGIAVSVAGDIRG